MSDDENPIAKLVRLQNGDDVIAEVIEMEDETGVTYTLFHPLKVVYIPSDTTGYLTVAFMPWVFPRLCEQQEFVIHSQDILFISNVTNKMNDYYWENLDYFAKKVSVEEEKVNEQVQQEDAYQKLKEALVEAGLDKKKVYH